MSETLLVTGTDTGVGKTVVTAAIAACAKAHGRSVAVMKPAQTGIVEAPVESDEPDIAVVRRLADPTALRELASYPDPLAPLAAAEESGLPQLSMGDVIEAVGALAEEYDVVLIEGAGGLLVPMGERRWTVADLAMALRVPAVVVARAGLGTLNHTALTLEALTARGLPGLLVLGSWPAEPELVEWRNLVDLPGELVGALPAGAGGLSPESFRAAAPSWLAPVLYGDADPRRLRRDGAPALPDT
jgi:dethiobiotin synthetase